MVQLLIEVNPEKHFFEINVIQESVERMHMPNVSNFRSKILVMIENHSPFQVAIIFFLQPEREIMARDDVDTRGCCVPKELSLLRELCFCDLRISVSIIISYLFYLDVFIQTDSIDQYHFFE